MIEDHEKFLVDEDYKEIDGNILHFEKSIVSRKIDSLQKNR